MIYLSWVAAIAAAAGCHPSPEELCGKDLSRLESELANQLVALQPWDTTRAPASEYVPLAARDRESWQAWAISNLKDVQHFSDAAAEDARFSAAHEDLTVIANELVAFHGYADQSQPMKMISALQRIRVRAQRAKALVCQQSH